MSIFVGGTEVAAVKVGSQDVAAVYVGSTQIWPPASSGITIINRAMSNLSVSNRTVHDYTYNFVGAGQDGTTALIICFFGDTENGGITPNVGTLVHKTVPPAASAGTCYIFYYVPDSSDYTTGSIDLSYTTASLEVFQFNVFEISGFDLSSLPTSLVGATDSDESNDDRATCGPLSLSANDGDLMLVWGGVDDLGTVALDTDDAKGFTDGGYYPPGGGAGISGIGAHQFHYRIADSTTTFDTPIYSNTLSEEMGTIGVVLKAA